MTKFEAKFTRFYDHTQNQKFPQITTVIHTGDISTDVTDKWSLKLNSRLQMLYSSSPEEHCYQKVKNANAILKYVIEALRLTDIDPQQKAPVLKHNNKILAQEDYLFDGKKVTKLSDIAFETGGTEDWRIVDWRSELDAKGNSIIDTVFWEDSNSAKKGTTQSIWPGYP